MSERSKTSSVQLSRILNSVLWTDALARCRGFHECRVQLLPDPQNVDICTIGSTADGFKLEGSDIDIMYVMNSYCVSDGSDVSGHNHCPLQAAFTSNSAAYTCICVQTEAMHIQNTYRPAILRNIVFYNGHLYSVFVCDVICVWQYNHDWSISQEYIGIL